MELVYNHSSVNRKFYHGTFYPFELNFSYSFIFTIILQTTRFTFFDEIWKLNFSLLHHANRIWALLQGKYINYLI